MTLHQIVLKLVGKIEPVGETNEDDIRFENLKVMTDLIENLLSDIRYASKDKKSGQYSISRSGKYADKFLSDLGLKEE